MNDFLVVFNKQGRILRDIIDKRTDEERSDLDIYPLLTNCTLDIICGRKYVYILIQSIGYNLNLTILSELN